jgi:taurine dioxygenase
MMIEPIDARLGACIRGVDLNQLNDVEFGEIHKQFLDYGLLAFKDQALSPEQQVEFSRRFGELEVHLLKQYNHPEHEEVFVLSNIVVDGKPIGIADGGSYWHSDLAFQTRPAMATMLNAKEIPAGAGDTLFINMYQAWEELGDDWKQKLAPLRAIHRYRAFEKNGSRGTKIQLTDAQKEATPDVVHPVVRTHPETGQKCLFVHPGMTAEILGVSEGESDEILDMLFQHCTDERFVMRYKWNVGDVVIWDNRCTMHSATTRELPPEMRRLIYRTTIRGDVPR